jgi:ribosomal protein L7/L12
MGESRMKPERLQEFAKAIRILNAAEIYSMERILQTILDQELRDGIELTPAEVHHLSISKIDVIKSVRSRTGLTLTESKDFVDDYLEKNPRIRPSTPFSKVVNNGP